jgi:hypothetical protein
MCLIKKIHVWFATPLFFFLLLVGCSKDSLQRSSYEMFRTMQLNECLQKSDMNTEDCYQTDNYDQYQQWRQERLKNER